MYLRYVFCDKITPGNEWKLFEKEMEINLYRDPDHRNMSDGPFVRSRYVWHECEIEPMTSWTPGERSVFVPRSCYVAVHFSHFITELKIHHRLLFTYHTHDDFDSADPSRKRDACHTSSVKLPCSPWVLVDPWIERLREVMGAIPVADSECLFVKRSCI